MRFGSKIALKQFLESVEATCARFSKEELTQLILSFAHDISIAERIDFLKKIQNHAKGEESEPGEGENHLEEVICNIQDLREEIDERIQSINDGSFFEEYDEWSSYYEDGPDLVSEEQIDSLEQFFTEAKFAFFDNALEDAEAIYSELFQLIDEFEEVEDYCGDDTIDFREERARYCRTIYEIEKPENRVEKVLKAIKPESGTSMFRLDFEEERMPFLEDVKNTLMEEPEGWKEFLPAWRDALGQLSSERSRILLLEAQKWLEGVEGVRQLAMKWKEEEPRGYLFLIQQLIKAGEWKEAFDVGREALEKLPPSFLRKQVSEYVIQVSEKMDDDTGKLIGKREQFFSSPRESELLCLIEEAGKQSRRDEELKEVLHFFQNRQTGDFRFLYIKSLLMAGDFHKAFHLGRDIKAYGWSYNESGIIVGVSMMALTSSSEQGGTINKLVKYYIDHQDPFGLYGTIEADEPEITIHAELLHGMRTVKLNDMERKSTLEWVIRISRERVDYIVSGKFRKSYSKAALVLGALAETLILLEKKEEAEALIQEYCQGKFSRYSAFRREVQDVFEEAPLLQSFRI